MTFTAESTALLVTHLPYPGLTDAILLNKLVEKLQGSWYRGAKDLDGPS